MELVFARELFFVLAAGVLGGLVAKLLKLQPIIGYLVAGVIFGNLFPLYGGSIQTVAQIGIILLLFSIGLEMSLSKLGRMLTPAIIGAGLQILIGAGLLYIILALLGIGGLPALVLAGGFSLSSTAVIFKILSDRGESDTIYGELMIAWSLVQDLAVVPIIIVLPILVSHFPGGAWILPIFLALAKALLVVAATIFLGRIVVPFVVHNIAGANSRELLVLTSIALALGTAALTSYLGISPALGAFLAGLVISHSQENHAIFAETRPLRDLFVALFFITLGFLIRLPLVFSHWWLILALVAAVIVVKSVVVWFLSLSLGFHGKTAVATALGLSQAGEFSFVLFSLSQNLKILSPEIVSIGLATSLLTLVATPPLFRAIDPLWRKIRAATSGSKSLHSLFSGFDRRAGTTPEISGHIIICGFGRVGGWVGKALESMGISYVVVDYDQSVVSKEKERGTPVIYGDPGEAEVLEQAGISEAKAVVIAIPDRVAQEEIISLVQTKYPKVKIITRVHQDEDFEKMKLLRVQKIIQPEFEASIAIVRAIMDSMGKSKDEVRQRVRSMRVARSKS